MGSLNVDDQDFGGRAGMSSDPWSFFSRFAISEFWAVSSVSGRSQASTFKLLDENDDDRDEMLKWTIRKSELRLCFGRRRMFSKRYPLIYLE